MKLRFIDRADGLRGRSSVVNGWLKNLLYPSCAVDKAALDITCGHWISWFIEPFILVRMCW
jgi:hypothetical protein